MPLTAEELNELAAFAGALADAAEKAILPYFRKPIGIADKGGAIFDPVTEADSSAERAMRQLIGDHYPSHSILGEEEEAIRGESDITWVLDPIDGTRAFISGLPLWGTLIAVNDGERPVFGMMHQPFTGERFTGTAAGSYCNDVKLATRQCQDVATASLMCTTPEMFQAPADLAAFQRVAQKTQMVRYGGDCYAYCMLASGFVDVVIEASLKPYDVQALIPIIEGAGGIITTWDGDDAQNGGAIVACGDPRLHPGIIKLLRG
ncbi:histidinol-phosphatase [Pseudomonas sp. BGr12]|uniref:histidinol-phosphatase n=1 Tax=Pseudomonas sp. BGr12 TaxID=2936269 RepID=UPI002559CD03|nr:histidinol-phosphatase [Pseudomonas sp. BJa5]MDL2428426.1 histidinol-phosphatase [Pseudomonas sp. BJa5]